MVALGTKTFTADELASLLNLTRRQVYANEARLGLRPFRIRINRKVVRWHVSESLYVLKQKGYIR